ncbi:MAG: hypothetical protein HY021_04255 [Burkholderiales bacterium]|nr:hypothetical protein [Burkholderiales bacterium]
MLLLRFFLSQIKGSGVANLIRFNPPGVLPVSGGHDALLDTWIKEFQTAVHNNGNTGIASDGIVDPARGTATQKSTHTHSTYTIVLMNNAFRSNQPAAHAALFLDQRVPPTLRESLLRNTR